MNNWGYYFAKIKGKLTKSHESIITYYRRNGVKIGTNCLICSNPLTREPFLIDIGNNVTISTHVTFVTHDNSVKLLFPNESDCFGKINIGNNCFIGENSTLLYGITIGDNTIVAAGSVVTKSFEQTNVIVGGNPAKIIGDWKSFSKKYQSKAIKRADLVELLNINENFLVRR